MLLDVLQRHVPERAERGLDIGGGGDVAEMADALRGRFVCELHAVDLDADVALARAKGIAAQRCDIDREALPYPDAFFGLALFLSVIEHLYNPHHVLREIARALAPGGMLVVEAPNAVALGRRFDALAGRNPFEAFNRCNAAHDKLRMEHCAVFYTADEIGALLAPDFDVLECTYCMHTPPAGLAKRVLREAAFRLNPRLADCFFVAARRK